MPYATCEIPVPGDYVKTQLEQPGTVRRVRMASNEDDSVSIKSQTQELVPVGPVGSVIRAIHSHNVYCGPKHFPFANAVEAIDFRFSSAQADGFRGRASRTTESRTTVKPVS